MQQNKRTPLEAGLHRFVKTENWLLVGREALLRRQELENRWCMKLLEVESGDIDPFYLHTVH